MDVDSIPLGVKFPNYIGAVLQQCAVELVVVGPGWLDVKGPRGRRLDDPGDFVRLEIEAGLAANLPVIPLIVQRAQLPAARKLPASLRPLVHLNGVPVRPDPDFEHDMARVTSAVEHWLAAPHPSAVPLAPPGTPTALASPSPLAALDATLPLPAGTATQPVSPVTPQAVSEATHASRQPHVNMSVKVPTRADEASRVTRRTPVALALVLALIVVVGSALALSQGFTAGAPSIPAPTETANSRITQTINAWQTGLTRETETAQAWRPADYKVTAPGPCDKTGSATWSPATGTHDTSLRCGSDLQTYGAGGEVSFIPPAPDGWGSYAKYPTYAVQVTASQLIANRCGEITTSMVSPNPSNAFLASSDGTWYVDTNGSPQPGPFQAQSAITITVQVLREQRGWQEVFQINGNPVKTLHYSTTSYNTTSLIIGIVTPPQQGVPFDPSMEAGELSTFAFSPA
jgi:hypothetical protein